MQQASANARDLRLWGRSRADAFSRVVPVVTLWGSGTGALEVIILNGVAVVPGPSAKAWRETLPAGVWTAEQVDQAWSVLERQSRARDDHADPMPMSMQQLAAGAAATAVAAGMVAGAALLERLGSLYAWGAVCAGLAALAQPLRRKQLSRLPALGWQTGLLAMAGVAGLGLLQR